MSTQAFTGSDVVAQARTLPMQGGWGLSFDNMEEKTAVPRRSWRIAAAVWREASGFRMPGFRVRLRL